MRHWHTVQHVGTFIGTLACKNEKLTRFWHVDKQALWHVSHTGTQAHYHVDHVGTQARMARHLANSVNCHGNTIMQKVSTRNLLKIFFMSVKLITWITVQYSYFINYSNILLICHVFDNMRNCNISYAIRGYHVSQKYLATKRK